MLKKEFLTLQVLKNNFTKLIEYITHTELNSNLNLGLKIGVLI